MPRGHHGYAQTRPATLQKRLLPESYSGGGVSMEWLGGKYSPGSIGPASNIEGWVASQGHRRNLLDCTWTDMGIGANLSPTGPWWA
ncbi:CAP domain-containing protein [Streptomyces syringium]|uniref:CAP domain-containing protein n=1 Tax=Streptomyces syringium TaxID=76729 RepID=UPI00343E1C1B